MSEAKSFLVTIAGTGFAVAFLHAAIPTHWLPFVLAARAQGWGRAKTLTVAALAGGGHVLFTTVLGFLIVWLGIAVSAQIGRWFPWIAGGALVAFGLYYLGRQLSGKAHAHIHLLGQCGHGEHCHHGHAEAEARGPRAHPHPHEQDDAAPAATGTTAAAEPPRQRALAQPRRVSDWVVVTSLLALLTFSPCEGFLPIYLTSIRYGWRGFALLSVILAGATLAGMLLFTWLTLAGIEKLKLKFVEEYEGGILGAAMVLLGLLVIVLER